MTDFRLGHYFSDGERWEFAVDSHGIACTAHTGPTARQDAINELPAQDREEFEGVESVAFELVEELDETGASGREERPDDAPLVLEPEQGGLPIIVFGREGEVVGTFKEVAIGFLENLKAALDAAAGWEPRSGPKR